MNRTSLIGHVVEIHAATLAARRPADALLADFFRDRRYLGSRDRRFISETLYGMLRRHRFLLETVGRAGLPATSAILYAAHALGEADPAVLAEDIAPLCPETGGAPGCAGILRALQAVDLLADPAITPNGKLALAVSLPDFLVDEWVDRLGAEEAAALCHALNQPAPTTARVNTLKVSVDDCIAMLEREGVPCTRTALSASGIRFGKRLNIRSLSAFRQGFFEMQDEGSQLVSLLLEPVPGGFVVDACAGGGGKTLHLAALMGDRGTIAALDVSERRLGDIRARLSRNSIRCVRVRSATTDRKEIAGWRGRADGVLVDAPCSGTGTLRRNPALRLALTAEGLEDVVRIQRAVLRSSADFVRPGGRLVYSSCTLLRRENEDAAEDFLRSRPEFQLISVPEILRRQGLDWHEEDPFLHLFPHRHGTDGFFAAAFTRLR